MTTNSIK